MNLETSCNFSATANARDFKFVHGSAMQSLVISECFLSGRGQGHVSNFYVVDLENFVSASRSYTGDIHNSTVVGSVYDTLPSTKLPTSYYQFCQDLSYK